MKTVFCVICAKFLWLTNPSAAKMIGYSAQTVMTKHLQLDAMDVMRSFGQVTLGLFASFAAYSYQTGA